MASGSLRRVLALKTVDGKALGQEEMIFDQELPSNGTVLEPRDDGRRYRILDYAPPYTEGDREVYVARVEPVE